VERLGDNLLSFARSSFSFLLEYITLGRVWQGEIKNLDEQLNVASILWAAKVYNPNLRGKTVGLPGFLSSASWGDKEQETWFQCGRRLIALRF
jgi:hypothetical protein